MATISASDSGRGAVSRHCLAVGAQPDRAVALVLRAMLLGTGELLHVGVGVLENLCHKLVNQSTGWPASLHVVRVTSVTSAAGVTESGSPRLAPLQTIEPVSAVSAVTRRLLDFFTSGEIAAGDRLPAERQLAAQLGGPVGGSGGAHRAPGAARHRQRAAGFGDLPQGQRLGAAAADPELGPLARRAEDRRAHPGSPGAEVHVARLAADLATDDQRAAIEATLVTMREHARTSGSSSRPTCGSTRSSRRRPKTRC